MYGCKNLYKKVYIKYYSDYIYNRRDSRKIYIYIFSSFLQVTVGFCTGLNLNCNTTNTLLSVLWFQVVLANFVANLLFCRIIHM